METNTLKIVEGSKQDLVDAFPLFKGHWDEVAKNKDVMVLSPDWSTYDNLDKINALMILVVYDGDNVVGYSVNMLYYHLHYRELKSCQNDIIFLKKEYRETSTIGLRLIKATEKLAKEKGATIMLWHAKENSTFSKILPKMRYNIQDISYSKILKD